MLVAVGLLAGGCARHTVPPPASPDGEVPVVAALKPAVPTIDPIDPMADFEMFLANLTTDDYEVDVYGDGMVRWRGKAGVQSLGERHGRLPAETRQALIALLDDAHLGELPQNVGWAKEGCESTHDTSVAYAPGADVTKILVVLDYHCPQNAMLLELETRFAELVGFDQWIHGNPPPAGGALPDGEHRVVTFSRGVCYPECPEYEVTVYDDGLVVWEGRDHVAVEGELRARLPAGTVDAIVAAFTAARFWELDDTGEVPVPDEYGPRSFCTNSATITTTFQQGDRHKTLDETPCDEPTTLTRLEEAIEWLVIGDATWIATPVPVITLERAGGATISILDNGRILENGQETAWLHRSELRALTVAFEDAQFFTLDISARIKKKCPGTAHTILTYVGETQTRTIDDDGCIRSDALHALEQQVTAAASR
jgi:hypothetical protein